MTDLSTTARTISEARDILQRHGDALQVEIAARLCEAAHELSGAVKEIAESKHEEWMTPEQCQRLIHQHGKSWERVSKHLPRRYVSERIILYPRSLVDAALYAADSPEKSVVKHGDEKHDGKNPRHLRSNGDSGGARSLTRALGKGS